VTRQSLTSAILDLSNFKKEKEKRNKILKRTPIFFFRAAMQAQ